MRHLIAGNWKMHTLGAEARALAQAIAAGSAELACDLLVCPPFVHVAGVAACLAGTSVAVGGQDCHAADQGAHTGDVAAPMLRDVGASFVILGHSERRQNHLETDAQVLAKTEAAIRAGLTPIVCVGETEAERERGDQNTVVGRQLEASLPDGFANAASLGVIAYEPVWAIGTGKTATEADVAAMHGFIRQRLVARFGAAGGTIRILYGGSVRPANAASLMAVPDVAGALVGGASLKAEDFLAIARAVKAG